MKMTNKVMRETFLINRILINRKVWFHFWLVYLIKIFKLACLPKRCSTIRIIRNKNIPS